MLFKKFLLSSFTRNFYSSLSENGRNGSTPSDSWSVTRHNVSWTGYYSRSAKFISDFHFRQGKSAAVIFEELFRSDASRISLRHIQNLINGKFSDPLTASNYLGGPLKPGGGQKRLGAEEMIYLADLMSTKKFTRMADLHQKFVKEYYTDPTTAPCYRTVLEMFKKKTLFNW